MTVVHDTASPLRHADRFFIGSEWAKPSSSETIDVIDSIDEELSSSVAEARDADIDRAVGAARSAFDDGLLPYLGTPRCSPTTAMARSRPGHRSTTRDSRSDRRPPASSRPTSSWTSSAPPS